MSTRCVTYPQDEPLVMIRTSQVRICEGNLCAAALLSYFERWHENRVDNAEQAEHKNKVAALHGETGMQDTSLLQYHTEEKMEAGLLYLYGRKTIRKALDLLKRKGFLSTHNNPNPHYRFDKTHYFRFYPERVQAEVGVFVHEVKMPHREGQNTSSQFTGDDDIGIDETLMAVHEVKMPDGEGENTSWSGKNAAPIEEKNKEIEKEEDFFVPVAEEVVEEDVLLPDVEPATAETLVPGTPEWLVDLYNTATPPDHPKVIKLSPSRRSKAQLRLDQFPEPAFWQKIMEEICQSPLLLGQRPSKEHPNFCANFDWLLEGGKNTTENCLKVAEGRYHDRSTTTPTQPAYTRPFPTRVQGV